MALSRQQKMTLMQAIILVSILILSGLVDASQSSVSGSIIDVDWGSNYNEFSGGYSGNPVITIKNTGSEAHVFYVQVATQDPTGKWDELGLRFLSTKSISPGKKIKFSDVLITVHPFYDNMPRGYYNGRVTLYADHFKKDKLDSQTQQDAFNV